MTAFRSFARIFAGFAAFTLLTLAGCGGPSGPPAISVAVSPATATLIGGATQQFAATVSNDSSNSGVTWSATTGTISSSTGFYTAPAVITTTSATITATSVKDPTKTGTATVTLTPISVSAVSPATINLGTSSTQTFTASVSNDSSNSGVTWSVSGGGSISSSGVYSAPTTVISTPTTVTVTATSVKDPTKSGTPATITLQPITIGAVTPASVTLNGGGTQTFSGAALAYDGSNSGVTWSVSPSSGAGTIVSTTGAYTAPAVVGAVTSATITAASVKDPTKTSTATVTLTPISVSYGTNTSATLDAGQQYGGVAANIANDASNSGISFTVAAGGGDIGSSSTTSTIIATAPYNPIYYTPASVPTQTTTTITAASVKDPTKTSIFSVTLNPAMAWTTPNSNTATLTAATTNTAYNYTFAVSGGTGTKSYAVVSGALPTGLSLSTSGAITGTPTGAAGTSNFVVHVTDQSSNPSVLSGTFTIVVSAAPLVWTAPAAPITLPTMTVGTAMTPYTLTTTGGTGAVTYTVNSGTLPTGVTLTGNVISGTPTQPTIVAGNVVTFLATDSATPTHVTATSSNVTMIANPVTLAITNTSLPTGYVGAVYNSSGYQMTSTGGVSPITWSMPATDGLTISSTGLITGTPTGTYGSNVTITASDSAINQHQSKPISLLLTVSSAPTITTSPTLPYATVGTAYSQTLVGSGGSGSGYTFTIISGQSSLTALGSTFALSSGGVLSGTPTASGTATFTVQVKDSANNTGTVNFTLNVYAVLTLTTPSSSVPGPGTVGQAYSATIGGLGGLAPYTYQVNGNVVATNGTVNLGYNLILTNNGSVLNIAGTPNTATTITFTAQVKDANNTTVGPYSYSIVIGTNYSISGTINLNNYCGGSPPAVPSVTVTLSQSSTQIAQTTTTNGQYTFSNIPAGTYTITPSPSISGTTGAVFYPATSSVTLTSSNSSGNNFGVALGYSVSGTLTYAGTATGRAYISLANKNCGGNSSPGTSLASVSSTGTAYTIRGVAPGSYSVSVWTDTLGHGDANTADPYGSGNVTVGTAAVTGSNFTITDPGVTTLTSAPSIQSVNPITSSAGGTGGALLAYSGIQNSNSVEMATSYTVQWSTTSSFTTITDSQVFPANGVNGTNIWLLNSATHPSLTSSSSYYFRVYGTSAGTSVSPYGVYEGSGSSPLLVSMAAPTGGTTQTGSVVLGATATGPLYVGFYNTSTGVFYGEAINSPAATQAFSVNVPAGTTYYFVAVQDQNNDGYIDAGDVTNTNNLKTLTTVPDSNATLTLPTTSTYAAATTSYFSSTSSGGSSQNYSVMAGLSGLIKQPVAVVLTTSSNADGANLVVPQDLGLCTNCGSSAFETNGSTNLVVPSVGDTYGFSVTYSDTTTGTATGTVAGVLGNSALATILSPYLSNNSSLTPTFTWTYPANASNYTYQFQLCCSTNGNIWQIPGSNSHSNGGFTSAQIPGASITWGVDPTNGSNSPSPSSLTLGTTYNWQLQTNDTNGDSATRYVNFTP